MAPVALRVIRETATLYLQQQAEQANLLSSPDSLTAFWRTRLGALRNEVFEVAYLDSAYRLIRNGVETLEEGTVDRAAVYPRRVIEAALRRGAAVLVCAHTVREIRVLAMVHRSADQDADKRRREQYTVREWEFPVVESVFEGFVKKFV